LQNQIGLPFQKVNFQAGTLLFQDQFVEKFVLTKIIIRFFEIWWTV